LSSSLIDDYEVSYPSIAFDITVNDDTYDRRNSQTTSSAVSTASFTTAKSCPTPLQESSLADVRNVDVFVIHVNNNNLTLILRLKNARETQRLLCVQQKATKGYNIMGCERDGSYA